MCGQHMIEKNKEDDNDVDLFQEKDFKLATSKRRKGKNIDNCSY